MVAGSPAKPSVALRTMSGCARSRISVGSPPTCVSGASPSIAVDPEVAATSSRPGFASITSIAWRPIEPVAPRRATRVMATVCRQNAAMPTNSEKQFAARPEVYAAWGALREAISGNMDARRYELATFAAAQRIKSSYCSLAHGTLLRDKLGGWEPQDEVERAVTALAEQVADDATRTDDHVARLRELGLSDDEIFDVVLAAAARCFFAKANDAMGVLPDAHYNELDDHVREALVVGRPIASS